MPARTVAFIICRDDVLSHVVMEPFKVQLESVPPTRTTRKKPRVVELNNFQQTLRPAILNATTAESENMALKGRDLPISN